MKGYFRFLLVLILFFQIQSLVFSVDESLEFFSPNYFDEQNNVYTDINYLNNEFLSFKVCVDKNAIDVKSKISCLAEDDLNVELFDMKNKNQKCFFSNVDFNNIGCDDFKFEVDYSLNNKQRSIKRDFSKQKQSLLINDILSKRQEDLSPVELSYYLIVLNDIKGIDSQESIDVYDKLKNSRKNIDKCWPSTGCDRVQTATILNNLKLAGYKSDSRLLEDGKIYLNKNMLNNENNPFTFEIYMQNQFISNESLNQTIQDGLNNSVIGTLDEFLEFNKSESAYCDLTIDDNDSVQYLFENNKYDMLIKKEAKADFSFSCNKSIKKIKLTIYNPDGTFKENKFFDDVDSFSYDAGEFACIGENFACDFTTSIMALITYPNVDNARLLNNYIESFVKKDGELVYLDSKDVFADTGKYLHYKKNPDFIEDLKFKQNNDGSWGTDSKFDRVDATSWDILGLQKSISANSEYIEDGKKWIYYNEPVSGWGGVDKNTLAYMAIKEKIKPFVTINVLNSLKDTSKFNLKNPTVYNLKNLKLSFDNELDSYLSYKQDLGDLDAEDNLDFNVVVNQKFYGKKSGFLTLTGVNFKGEELELLHFPIEIRGPDAFNFSVDDEYRVSVDYTDIELKVNHLSNFSYMANCTYKNPFDGTDGNAFVSPEVDSIYISNKALLEGKYNFDISCNMGENILVFPIELNVNLSEKAFDLGVRNLKITDNDDLYFTLNSNLDNKQVVSFEVSGDLKGFVVPVEKEKIVAGKDSRDIYFEIKDPDYLMQKGNSLTGELLVKSNNGYTKKIQIINDINLNPVDNGSNWLMYTIIIIVFFVLVILLIRRYRQLQEDEYESVDADEDEYFY